MERGLFEIRFTTSKKLRTGKREKSAYPGYELDPAAKVKTRTEKICKHAGR